MTCPTLDTYSLTSAEVFATLGTVTKPPRPSFDYCTVTVAVGGVPVDVEVGTVVSRAEAPAIGAPRGGNGPRGLRILAEPGTSGWCSRYIGFREGTDDLLVRVRARTAVGGTIGSSPNYGPQVLCTVAEVGAEGATAAIAARKVRHWDLPKNSLGLVDACGLIEMDQVVALVGPQFGPQVARETGTYPAKHMCRWGKPGLADPDVMIYFQVTQPNQGVEETVAGRRTILHPMTTSQFTLCALDLPHVPFTLSGSTEPEVATVLVWFPSGPADACAVARNIANTAWPKLPTA